MSIIYHAKFGSLFSTYSEHNGLKQQIWTISLNIKCVWISNIKSIKHLSSVLKKFASCESNYIYIYIFIVYRTLNIIFCHSALYSKHWIYWFPLLARVIWDVGSLMPSWAVDNTKQSIKIDTGCHISLCGDIPSYKPKSAVHPNDWRIVGTANCLLSVNGFFLSQWW